MKKYDQITLGSQYGYLTVIGMPYSCDSVATYKCLCVCGNVKDVSVYRLLYNNIKSCGCKSYKKGDGSRGYRGYKGITGKKWNAFISNARRRKVDFELDIVDVWNKLEQQDFKCALSGIDISSGLETNILDASLDRINNDLPYVINNIFWTHKTINQMRWNLSVDRFLELCKLVLNNCIHRNLYSDGCVIFDKHKNWNGFGNISGHFWSIIRNRERTESILTIEEAWDLFLAQHGRCKLTGLDIRFSKTGNDNDVKLNRTASLVKINPSLDLTVLNAMWVHKDLSSAFRLGMYSDDMYSLSERVVIFNENKINK